MTTPIIDFLEKYSLSGNLRLHMPGHKGKCYIGPEKFDITEVDGADSLYDAEGIIAMSEANASRHFGSHTLYSAEGSSLAIRAMLYLACLYSKEKGFERTKILAGRNAHKTFVSSLALLDIEADWIYPGTDLSYLSCKADAEKIDAILSKPQCEYSAVYVTSPDYLGNICDIEAISKVCKKHEVLLLVDNAHGAYLKFLPQSLHPVDLGADLSCDSAHKTLPVLTGGAYLHISKNAHPLFLKKAKYALSLFGSTSPSYLIMASLDYANEYIDEGYRAKLLKFLPKVDALKGKISKLGFQISGDEALKITVCGKKMGYKGTELSEVLREKKIQCEFSDPDFLVMMLTPEISDSELDKICEAFSELPKREEIKAYPPLMKAPEKIMSPKEASFSKSEKIPVRECLGRVLSSLSVSCPPAVSFVMCGEKINESAIEMAKYYNIKCFDVVCYE